jgi:hypothetical protein
MKKSIALMIVLTGFMVGTDARAAKAKYWNFKNLSSYAMKLSYGVSDEFNVPAKETVKDLPDTNVYTFETDSAVLSKRSVEIKFNQASKKVLYRLSADAVAGDNTKGWRELPYTDSDTTITLDVGVKSASFTVRVGK